MRTLKLIANFMVPVLLVGSIVTMVILRVDTAEQIQRSAVRGNQSAALIACDAVHDAGLSQHAFLVKSFGRNPDARSKTFLVELAVSVEDNYQACLVKARALGGTNDKAHR